MPFGKRNRSARRFDVTMRASVEVLGRPPTGCIVRDVSDTGAGIELIDQPFVPKHFVLRFDTLGAAIRCETVRVTSGIVGIKFLFGNDAASLAARRVIRKILTHK